MTAATLKETVAAKIAEIGPRVQDAVVEHFATKEAEKRSNAIIKGMDDLSQIDRELNKVKRPDSITYNADRTVAGETYTKARLDEIEKLERKREKLVKALDKAISGEMGDLYNLAKGGE